jgi:cysteine-rich repeat protein
MSGDRREQRAESARTAALLLLYSSTAAACLQPNPAYDDSTLSGSESGETTLEGSSTTTTATTTAATSSAGESESATGTSAVTSAETSAETGVEPALCGDGQLDPGEICDDGNADDADGCLNCLHPKSCAEILTLAPASPSGPYHIDPKGSGAPWPVTCDMDRDGGGWTGFSVQDTCNGHLDSAVVALKKAESEGIDRECRPFSFYANGGEYAYYWDITFPPGFSAFFLLGYEVKGLGDVELKYPQVLWEKASEWPNGSLSLGNASDAGPLTNWAADGGMIESFLDGQILPYPKQDLTFELGQGSDTLRIGWGEIGQNPEGLFPWWSGQIFVR